ncbi:unnamed protein product [Mytilus coruscus]|uniref:Tyr recombinase domain-containing protein n=1 Tax=Mytilus coruscus TaxID=42192 RepID=A0A6J8ECN5_MYTCO|nr:unnamed protein product [Mytilus coruscus]
MVASEYGVPYAKLFHKRLHITKNEQLRKHRGNYDAKFRLNEMCKQDINWWIDNIETSKKYVCVGNPEIIIRSDAFLTGWGGVYESQSTGGIGYSGLNTARSALSSFMTLNGHDSIGKHNLVKRFMRGIFQLRPSLPRYNFTWNVSDLLNYLDTLENNSLTLKQITLKCVSLLSLLTVQRLQSIHLLDIRNLEFSNDIVKIKIGDILKQTRPGKHLNEIVLNSFVNTNLCIVTCLKLYIKMTEKFRGKEKKFFVSFVALYKGVSKDTISRWMKTVLIAAGID